MKIRKAPASANTLAFKSRLTSFTVWTEVSGHWLEVSSQPHALVTLHHGEEAMVPTAQKGGRVGLSEDKPLAPAKNQTADCPVHSIVITHHLLILLTVSALAWFWVAPHKNFFWWTPPPMPYCLNPKRIIYSEQKFSQIK
jgi:hypothetical protein